MEFSNSFDISIAWDIKLACNEALIWFKLTKDKFGSIKSDLTVATPTHSLFAWSNNTGELIISSWANFWSHKSLESEIEC